MFVVACLILTATSPFSPKRKLTYASNCFRVVLRANSEWFEQLVLYVVRIMAFLRMISVMVICCRASSIMRPWAEKKTHAPIAELTPKAIILQYVQQVLHRPDVIQSGDLEYETWESAGGNCDLLDR